MQRRKGRRGAQRKTNLGFELLCVLQLPLRLCVGVFEVKSVSTVPREWNSKTVLTQSRKGRREAQRKTTPDFELLCVLQLPFAPLRWGF